MSTAALDTMEVPDAFRTENDVLLKEPKRLTQRTIKKRGKSLARMVLPVGLPMILMLQPQLTSASPLSLLTLTLLLSLLVRLLSQKVSVKSRKIETSPVDHCSLCCSESNCRHGGNHEKARLAADWRVRVYRRMPWRLLSRQWGNFTSIEFHPWLVFVIIWVYARLFKCKVHEAEKDDIRHYPSLAAFFRRKLKAGVRPVDSSAPVISPADGTVTFLGDFEGGFLQQVKGVHYSLNYFLGLKTNDESRVHAITNNDCSLLKHKDGSTKLFQWVIYLSPGDYHRFHSPTNWVIKKRRHFPGELMSVKPSVVAGLPGLFHLNERVCWLGEWTHGFFSMTAVGATNVGSIEASFEPELTTNRATVSRKEYEQMHTCARRSFHFSERDLDTDMRAGEEFGHFNLGSTLVLLFEAPRDFDFKGDMNACTQVGKAL